MPDIMFSVSARGGRVAGAQQDGDVADFLRDLVRRNRQRGGDPERNRGQHRGRDDRAVDEGVERVADDDQRRGAAVWASHSWPSSSWQWRHSTSFSSRKNVRTPASSVPSATCGRQGCERFRQQRQQCHAEQRADRVADRPRHEPGAKTVTEEQERGGREQAAEAAEHAQPDGRREGLHRGSYQDVLGATCWVLRADVLSATCGAMCYVRCDVRRAVRCATCSAMCDVQCYVRRAVPRAVPRAACGATCSVRFDVPSAVRCAVCGEMCCVWVGLRVVPA